MPGSCPLENVVNVMKFSGRYRNGGREVGPFVMWELQGVLANRIGMVAV